jgi:hypothetical protein
VTLIFACLLWAIGIAAFWIVASGVNGRIQAIPVSVWPIPALIGAAWLLSGARPPGDNQPDSEQGLGKGHLMNERLKQLIQDGGTDRIDAMRVAFLVWSVLVFIVWAIATYRHSWSLQPIPDSVVAVLALLAGAKAVQRFGEHRR